MFSRRGRIENVFLSLRNQRGGRFLQYRNLKKEYIYIYKFIR